MFPSPNTRVIDRDQMVKNKLRALVGACVLAKEGGASAFSSSRRPTHHLHAVVSNDSSSSSSSLHPSSSSSSSLPSSPLHLSAIDRGYETPINIEETAYRDVPTFENWAYNYAGIITSPGFQLASSNEYGLGETDVYAMTSQDMPQGTCALYVPEQFILSSSKAMAELRTSDMEAAEKIVYSVNAESEIRQYYLIVKLLVEYERGEESPWFAWLNS